MIESPWIDESRYVDVIPLTLLIEGVIDGVSRSIGSYSWCFSMGGLVGSTIACESVLPWVVVVHPDLVED
jgi:hypothetical protein